MLGDGEGRYRHFYRIIAEARRSSYTQGQAVTIARSWDAKVGKFGSRVPEQVAKCWAKLDDEQEAITLHVPAAATGRHRNVPAAEPIPPVSLTTAVSVFRRWLHLTDIAPLLALTAALVANRAEGDPVWLLLVGAPSTGKTEMLSASAGLPWIHPAARVTEASLLSGTSAKERARSATGGLLRQVGDFGVLLCKDFTSVLAQNKDASAEALAALREVYDGSWDRPVGTDGGKVLHWSGKCGLVGGVTPALDRYQSILSALGDRFLLLRLADPDQQESGKMALTHRGHEKTMRAELAAALSGLVAAADPARINDPLTDADEQRLIDLASFTARGRTAVMRDGYTRELLYLPQAEGPGRLVTAYARMLGALRAIGCDDPAAWDVLYRIAVSCMTAARAAFARELVGRGAFARTAELCFAARMSTKHGREHLEDLALLGLAERTKTSEAANAPDTWLATEALRALWPKAGPINTPQPQGPDEREAAERSAQNGSVEPSLFVSPTFREIGQREERRPPADHPDDADDEYGAPDPHGWPAGSFGEEANR
jgi:hypothetical protein